jgi:acetyl esterase/lipase
MKKTIVATALMLLIAHSVQAQLNPSARWTVETFVDYGFIEPDITYLVADGVELKVDVYRPKNLGERRVPTVVFFHGGGWRRGTKESYSLRVLPWMELGWNVVNVEYRMSPVAKAPAAIEDARCAVRWVFKNSDKFGFDRSRIVVSGQSAGGHLALMAGIADSGGYDSRCPGEPFKVAAIVNWYGIADVSDLLEGRNKMEFALEWVGENRSKDREFTDALSPLSHVRRGLPPIISIHGDADPTVPYSHSVRLHAELTKAGVPNLLHTVRGGDHGPFSKAEGVEAYSAIRRFLFDNGVR